MTYDFRRLLHLPISEVGGAVSFGEAFHLVKGLCQDQGTSTFAALHGWDYVMDMQTMFTGSLLLTVSNMLRDEKQEPITIPWPWPDKAAVPKVSDEERAALRATLDASSAFAQVHE